MRITRPLLLSAVLLLGASACSEVADQGIVNDEDPLTSENGLTSNGLTSNGLTSNGLTSNGLTSNGLQSGSLTGNTAVTKALRDTTPTGDLTRLFFRYLVSCALPTGHSVTYTWTDSTGVLHTEVNPGGLGFAPDWETSAASQQDKEIVSACVGARTNSKGIAVPLSLRGKNISGLTVSSSERSTYTYGEGAFWGNVFASTPYLYTCTRVAFNSGVATSQYINQGRTCTTGGCGLITSVGACYTWDVASSGQACFNRPSNNDWVSDCNQQKSIHYTMTENVLTTWLMP
jgi:hypothetical protein